MRKGEVSLAAVRALVVGNVSSGERAEVRSVTFSWELGSLVIFGLNRGRLEAEGL